MKKKAKQAFGIFDDGLSVKMVHLVKIQEQLFLQCVDRVELDTPLYHPLTDNPATLEDNPWDTSPDTNEVTLDDFDSDSITSFKLQPFDTMLGAHNLRHGVVALNVQDDNLHILTDVKPSPRAIRQAVKKMIPPELFKAGEWQYSILPHGSEKEVWIHSGVNKLLELIVNNQKKAKVIPFYQLADSNDIALTDFFKTSLDEDSGTTLLVYIGQEYRKAFLFQGNRWINTFPLQISQRFPEPDIIYSKLSLALDNAQVPDPAKIVICGDFASTETLEYLKNQYLASIVEFIKYSGIEVNSEMQDQFDLRYLIQFALPIALAYKALNNDNPELTRSNFLPSAIIEGQKVFKIAWHGFVILFLIFAMTMYGTVSIMQSNLDYRNLRATGRRLEQEVNQKRLEAAEIKKIRSDLEQYEANIEAMRTLLQDKNPWTEILHKLIQGIQRRPITWLTNLRLENGKLLINGYTTERRHVVGISQIFDNTKINKVTHSQIRNYSVWQFELHTDLPSVDWFGIFEADLEKLLKTKAHYEENPVTPAKPKEFTPRQQSETSDQSVTKAPSQSTKPFTGSLGPVPESQQLLASQELLDSIDPEQQKAYAGFLKSSRIGSTWHYRDLGTKFIRSYPQSEVLSHVRWLLAYRYYIDKEYVLSLQSLEPLLRVQNTYYPHALLLAARVEFAAGNSRYRNLYRTLISDYATHPLATAAREDLALIDGGGK